MIYYMINMLMDIAISKNIMEIILYYFYVMLLVKDISSLLKQKMI